MNLTSFFNLLNIGIWNSLKRKLQLVGVGVDFVFPLEEEGRKKEGRRNPRLAFSRRNDPTCLIFSDCFVGVWRLYGNCLESVWRVSGRCPLVVWRVS